MGLPPKTPDNSSVPSSKGRKPLLSAAVIEKNVVLNDIESIRGASLAECDAVARKNGTGG